MQNFDPYNQSQPGTLSSPSTDGENRTNLIINYLPQNMTDKELSSMFITIGPIRSTRIMRDGKSGYSYGFGFVEYQKPEDAARAINTLNGLQVLNKRIKVSYARPPGEDIKDTNLYVSNLPRDITKERLESWFCKYGTIVQSNVLKDKNSGIPRGVAFVRFDRRSQAMTAIEKMNGVVPPGATETLTVKVAEEHGKQKAAFYAGWQAGLNQVGDRQGYLLLHIAAAKESQMADNQSDSKETRTNLIINYLPQNMSDKELSSMFITIGPLQSAKIMRDMKTGYSFGFGFVDYMKPLDAVRAISTLNGLQVMNKRIKVSYARPPGEDIKGTNLYVANLPKDITQERLDSLFAPYGTIVQSNVLKDKNTGLPRGIAFVRFDKKDEAKNAIREMNGTVPPGAYESITVKVAEEHGKAKAAFYAGWQASLNQPGGDRPANRSYGQAMKVMANQRQVWQHGGGEYPVGQGMMPHRAAPGVMRNERAASRYNPIGMGGGYSNMYNWN